MNNYREENPLRPAALRRNSPHPSWASWRGHFLFPEEEQRPEAGGSSAAHQEWTGSTPPTERHTNVSYRTSQWNIRYNGTESHRAVASAGEDPQIWHFAIQLQPGGWKSAQSRIVESYLVILMFSSCILAFGWSTLSLFRKLIYNKFYY